MVVSVRDQQETLQQDGITKTFDNSLAQLELADQLVRC
jgi:hypothetical protein